jgi:hypothetical protein
LERWAEDNVIRATDRSQSIPSSYTASPRKAARQTDFYRIDPKVVIGGSPVAFESLLSQIEGDAKSALDQLEQTDVFTLDGLQVSRVLLYLGHQFTRTRSFRERMRAMIGIYLLGMLGDNDDDEYLRRLVRRLGQQETEETIAGYRSLRNTLMRDPLSVSAGREMELWQAGKAATATAAILYFRRPVVYRTPRPLITCDEPLVQLHEHMGAPRGGLWGAPIIVFPLSPTSILAMLRHDMPILLEPGATLTVAETLELNRSILGSTDRLAFEVPSQRLTEKLFLPDRPLALRVDPIRSLRQNGSDLLWVSTPSRWAGEKNAPARPVERWWPSIVPPARYPTAAEKEILKQFDAEAHW